MGVVSILVMRPWAFIQTFVPNSEEDASNLVLIGKVVSEKIFEKGGWMDGRCLDGSTISSMRILIRLDLYQKVSVGSGKIEGQ